MQTIKLAAALTLAATAASAENAGVSAGFSLFGPVLEGNVEVSENVEVRGFLISGLNFRRSSALNVAGASYTINGTARIGGFGALVDYYPTTSGWRMSGGVFMSATSISADFVGVQNFQGEVKLSRSIAPMVTTGYRHTFGGNWTIAADAGAVFTGISASSNSTLAQVQTEIQKINDELKKVDVLPYVSLTVGYRF